MPRPKKPKRADDPLQAYRRIRKKVPPPQRVISDRRRQIREEEARRDRDEP